MSFARKYKRTHDEDLKEKHKQVRKDKDANVINKRKIINIGTIRKKFER